MRRGLRVGNGINLGWPTGLPMGTSDSVTYPAPTITPSLAGGELLSNPDFETFTGGQADSWTKSGTPTLTQETTIKNSLTSSQKIVGDGGGVYQGPSLTRAVWYRFSAYLYVTAGQMDLPASSTPYLGNGRGNGAAYFTAAWGQQVFTGIAMANGASGPFARILVGGTTGYVDQATMQAMTFSSLRTYVGSRTGSCKIMCHPTVAAGTQCGMLVKYLDDNNFVAVLFNRATGTVQLYKLVAGIPTLVTSGAVTYDPGQELRVVINGTSFQMYYSGILVSSAQTISDSLGNDIYGFSTDASNSVGVVQTTSLGTARGTQTAIVFSFDDGVDTVYSQAYPYLASKGVHGTANIVTDIVGNANIVSWANLTEMNAAGWDIANHTKTGAYFPGLTQAQVEAELTGAKSALESHGFTRASRHVAYTSAGRNATSDAAMVSTGMLTGRIDLRWTPSAIELANYNRLTIPICGNLSNGLTLAQAKAAVDAVQAGQLIGVFQGHGLGPKDATHWEIADFQALVDYVIAAGIPILSMSEIFGS